MTSECFVYMQMPASLEVVTAGKFRHEVLSHGSAVGLFVYGRRYLTRPDAVPLDSLSLPLEPTEFRTTRFNGMFGALRDAAPDFWGRRVIDRRYPDRDLTEFDYLVHGGPGRIGALSFGPDVEPPPARTAETVEVGHKHRFGVESHRKPRTAAAQGVAGLRGIADSNSYSTFPPRHPPDLANRAPQKTSQIPFPMAGERERAYVAARRAAEIAPQSKLVYNYGTMAEYTNRPQEAVAPVWARLPIPGGTCTYSNGQE